MLFSNEKEWTADTLHSTDEQQKQRKKSDTLSVYTVWDYLCKSQGQVSEVLGPDCGGVRIRVHTFVKTHRALYLSG